MTTWDPITANKDLGPDEVDPEFAANALGKLLSFFHGEALAPTSPVGPGNAEPGVGEPSTSDTATGADVAPSGHVSPVPVGTGVNQAFGGAHPGIDLGVPLDTQLLAAASGKITAAGNNDPGGYGNMVEITTPDGFVLRYGHMHGMNVKVGDSVSVGQVIGKSGGEQGGPTSGNSTGAHLHFEVRANGHPVDPTPFLAGGYQIIGGTGDSTTPTTADPNKIAAVQLQNVINVLSGDPMISTEEAATSTTSTQTGATGDNDPGAVDTFLNAIKQKESGGDYTIRNTSGMSNAAGAYQFLGTTWKGLGGSTASAAEASPAEQDRIARAYALQLFQQFKSWRLVAAAWFGGPGIAEQMAAGKDVGSPAGQGSYKAYADSIAAAMSGGK